MLLNSPFESLFLPQLDFGCCVQGNSIRIIAQSIASEMNSVPGMMTGFEIAKQTTRWSTAHAVQCCECHIKHMFNHCNEGEMAETQVLPPWSALVALKCYIQSWASSTRQEAPLQRYMEGGGLCFIIHSRSLSLPQEYEMKEKFIKKEHAEGTSHVPRTGREALGKGKSLQPLIDGTTKDCQAQLWRGICNW